MNLSGLLPLIHGMPAYRKLIQELESGGQRGVVLDAAKPYLLDSLYRELGLPMLVITAQTERAKQLCDELLSWLGSDAPVQLFPEPDTLPYERLASDPATVQQRLQVLFNLAGIGKAQDAPPLIVASAHAVIQKTLPYDDFVSACHVLKKGMVIDLDKVLAKWIALGYEMANAVETPGTLSRRGGIIDIYPPNSCLPARIELLGDEVESIRFYDPETQRSVELVSSVAIVPAREMLFRDNRQVVEIIDALDLSGCNIDVKERIEEEIELLVRGQYFDGLESYQALFNSGALPDYLPQSSLLILDEPNLIEAEFGELETRAMELRQGQMGRGELPKNIPRPYFTWSELVKRLDRISRRLELVGWGTDEHHLLPFTPVPSYGGRLSVMLGEVKEMLKKKRRVIIISQQATRLSELLQEEDIFASPVLDKPPPPGSMVLAQGSLAKGWCLSEKSVLLTDTEIFGFTKKRRLIGKRAVRREAFLSDLAIGDYVVHIEHGIARFAGMTKMSTYGGEREYLILEYAAGDKLYVPNDLVDRVSRYIGSGGYLPVLSRLGTQEWARAKQRVRERAGSLAQELLALYSIREVVPGFAFSLDTVWQQEMEASFPYIETPDQLEAVREVKADMEKPKPMDRLVCGDVGYGKTEVAIRAAFKAVMDGMQVAVLVPTTVLAQQHYATFTERLGAFPIKVDVLSRFRSDKEQRIILDGLNSGTVDICIGTHRLLQKDVTFKNLGLVVIDEEQRFGVAHKERLKKMRQEVDVLTLTATPIPRTLHMSLTGVRDMSTMETPPEERLPIKTYVAEYDERLIREAILRELDRGGQVFFVHNRVETISHIATRLMELIPEAEIAIAHGQMPEERLESVMLDFSAGKSDVLVCTTIIESGLDMPNVNTLIVNQADKLGLCQLYQLRGRVGRGTNRAYAYFLYNKGKELTEAAQERLKTIFQATELGAGFRIAMKDLEIRGAGNLLGTEQSGHISAVGFELYCRLLAEAVEELRAQRAGVELKKPLGLPAPSIDLPLAAHIPEEYVADLSTRLTLYQRLAKLSSFGEVEDAAREFCDRFGPAPLPVRNLLYVVKIKALAARAGVETISTEEGQIVIRMRGGGRVDKSLLPPAQGIKVGQSQVRLDIKHFGGKWQAPLLKLLEKMATQPVEA